MFFLKKLITSILVPPGIFILLFLVITILAKECRIVRFIALFSAILLYLLSIEPCKDFLLMPLEKKFSMPDNKEVDAIVILGGGSYNSDTFKEDTINRLIAGYFLFKEIKKPVIVSGGSSEDKKSDALLMADFLRKMGIENNKIIEENKSKNTAENAIYVKNICKERRFKKIMLVTSAYHMTRVVKLFKNNEIEIVPYPTDFKTQRSYSIYSFLPKFSSFVGSTKAMREYIAIFLCHN